MKTSGEFPHHWKVGDRVVCRDMKLGVVTDVYETNRKEVSRLRVRFDCQPRAVKGDWVRAKLCYVPGELKVGDLVSCVGVAGSASLLVAQIRYSHGHTVALVAEDGYRDPRWYLTSDLMKVEAKP